jgi:eukaryotic-like serine/threonine-protein kinase
MATLPATISRYKIIKRLGEGGMGSLYLARDPDIDRLVAIKQLRDDVESDELRERFRREARSVGRLRHQNIVIVFDVGEDEGRPFIAMEYIEGQTLSGIIREKQPIPMDRKLQWIEQLCDGLAYAHRANIVHRDIKPANLMIDNDQTLKILDFGIARFGHAASTGMTQSGTLMGTINYTAPE